MLFCQLGRAHSLREICGGLASVEGRLNHLGVGAAPKRSTLSYANAHRPAALFEGVFHWLLKRCQATMAPRKFRFKNKLYSLDASVIDLCLSAFDWAKFRRTKGAVKLHLLLDHDGCLPAYCVITEGKTHEIRVARTLELPKGAIVVMDRGYVDYLWLDALECSIRSSNAQGRATRIVSVLVGDRDIGEWIVGTSLKRRPSLYGLSMNCNIRIERPSLIKQKTSAFRPG